MTTYNTGNSIGSTDPRDLYDNAENLDRFANSTTLTESTDRLGTSRKTLKGMEDAFDSFLASSGYTGTGSGGAIEDHAAGIEITAYNQIIRESGELYRLKASVSLPYTTSATWTGGDDADFVAVGDAALRQELADDSASSLGAALVGHKGGTVASFRVDNITELNGFAPADGFVVETTSYRPGWAGTALGPVGGSKYVYESGRAKSNHDGIRDISPTVPSIDSQSLSSFHAGTGEADSGGSGVWRLLTEELNVYQAGATGVSTDDQRVAVKNAIEAADSSLLFPFGNFYVSSPITINDRKILFRGLHKDGCQIIHDTGFLVIQGGSANTPMGFKNLRFKGNTADTGDVIFFDNDTNNETFWGNIYIQDCEFNTFNRAIRVKSDAVDNADGIGWLTLERVTARKGLYGLYCENSEMNAVRIIGSDLYQNKNTGTSTDLTLADDGAGIYIDGGRAVVIEGGDYEQQNIGIYLKNVESVQINADYFESNNKAAIILEDCQDVDLAANWHLTDDIAILGTTSEVRLWGQNQLGNIYVHEGLVNLYAQFDKNLIKTITGTSKSNVVDRDLSVYTLSDKFLQEYGDRRFLESGNQNTSYKSFRKSKDGFGGWASITADKEDIGSQMGTTVTEYVGQGQISFTLTGTAGEYVGFAIIGRFTAGKTAISITSPTGTDDFSYTALPGGYVYVSGNVKCSNTETYTLKIDNAAATTSDFIRIVGGTFYTDTTSNSLRPILPPVEGTAPIEVACDGKVEEVIGRGFRLGDALVFIGGFSGEPTSPEGWVTAPPGSLQINKAGGAGSRFWIKESGTGNTGWVPAATSDGTTGGSGSAGAGAQYVELAVNGTTYKVLHDGTV